MADLRALVTDWGGVLTSPLGEAMQAWCAGDGIDYAAFRVVMKEWLGTAAGDPVAGNPVHALERGEIVPADFERELGSRLVSIDGSPVVAAGLLDRMFAGFESDTGFVDLLRRAKAAGLSTALLSNSWGNTYPREGWSELFDAVVISGEVGMRKPEPEIYLLAADQLGLRPDQCVFVDDLSPNIRSAETVGMVGVLHTSTHDTTRRLEELFGIDLGPA